MIRFQAGIQTTWSELVASRGCISRLTHSTVMLCSPCA
jgi:hypothetical protein